MSEYKPAPSNLTPEEMVRHMEHHYPDMDGNWRRVLDMLEVAIEQGLDMRFGMNYVFMSDKEKHKFYCNLTFYHLTYPNEISGKR